MAKTPEQIVQEAQALVQQAQQSLDASEAFYRAQGLNPEKVRVVLEGQTGPKEKAEAEALFKADMEAVDREAAEEAARASFAAGGSSGGRKPRPMV